MLPNYFAFAQSQFTSKLKIQSFLNQLIFISTPEKETSYDIVKGQIERDVTKAAAELSKRDLFLT